jgi:Ca2+-binding RTX toxin-like protein
MPIPLPEDVFADDEPRAAGHAPTPSSGETSDAGNAHLLSFSTAGDIQTLQVLYQRGDANAGTSCFIHGGFVFWKSWELIDGRYRTTELASPVTADTAYTLVQVDDDASQPDATVKLYLNGRLVDRVSVSVTYPAGRDDSVSVGQTGHDNDFQEKEVVTPHVFNGFIVDRYSDDARERQVAFDPSITDAFFSTPRAFLGTIARVVRHNEALSPEEASRLSAGASAEPDAAAPTARLTPSGGDAGPAIRGTVHDDAIELRGDPRAGAGGIVFAGMGDDRVHGSEDADELYGDAGRDTLFGHAGPDLIDGGVGDDDVSGDDGDDTLFGGPGDDYLAGRAGADILHGGIGNDLIKGHAGDDILLGGPGNDHLGGSAGDDILEGGPGDGFYYGAQGDDTIFLLSWGGEPVPALDAAQKVEPDEPVTDDDNAKGALGADTIVVRWLIDAKDEIVAANTAADGNINYKNIAVNANASVHDHWVETIGNDLLRGFEPDRDTLIFEGHTVALNIDPDDPHRSRYIDYDGDGLVNDTWLSFISVNRVRESLGLGPGAHEGDRLGTLVVQDVLLDIDEIADPASGWINTNVFYGVEEPYDPNVDEPVDPPLVM